MEVDSDPEDLSHNQIIKKAPEETAAFQIVNAELREKDGELTDCVKTHEQSPFYIFRGVKIRKDDIEKGSYYFHSNVSRINRVQAQDIENETFLTEAEQEKSDSLLEKKVEIYRVIADWIRELKEMTERGPGAHKVVDFHEEEDLKSDMDFFNYYLMATTFGVCEYMFLRDEELIELISEAKKFAEKRSPEEEEMRKKKYEEKEGEF